MGRLRSAWLGLAGWLVASCTYSAFPAESTAAACLNTLDDDHDGRFNCHDPDCWHLALCQPSYDGGLPPLGPPNPPDQIPTIPDDPLVPPVGNDSMTDGSTPIDVPMTDAHRPDAPEDASVDAELPVVCSKYCPPDACNEDGSCNKPLVFGTFGVESIALAVPGMRDGVCFDYRFTCGLPFGCCDPDPIVTVYVGDTKAGFVTKADVREGVLTPDKMQVELREGDKVVFEVEDEDTLEVGDDEESPDPAGMFVCSMVVTAEWIEAGRLGCAPNADNYAFPLGEYYVIASVTPLDGEDEDHQGDMP